MRAATLIIKDGKILLMHRFKEGHEYYVIIGGHVEENESSETAAIREAKEETGFDVILDKKLWADATDFDTNRYHYFLVTKFSGELKLGGPEAKDHNEDNQYYPEWHSLREISKLNLVPEVIKKKIIETFSC